MVVTLVIVVGILLTSRFGLLGLIASLLIATITFFLTLPQGNDPEIASLRASLTIARDDVADIIQAYDTLLLGTTTEAIADRTLHFPALAEQSSTVPAIEEFQLRVAAARRFVSRLDYHIEDPSLDRASLEKLIAVTDERAAELSLAWADARRAAKRLGPGT
ncbi:hypothetical protein QP027_06520 [Corynebacterium breve]|uniref:Uncharacterized protein n=1 Tax=Corynebacterium breve TaxID=3049799 RepID=A0ABY8VDH6_9CORY|nr:hypothetical protein [Corynebacterium breve]WIM66790.1 hypothetical protein QP027_06520 [Corynebacterium breve]